MKRFVIIHTTPATVPTIGALIHEEIGECVVSNLLDDSILPEINQAGAITPGVRARLFAQVGADAVMVEGLDSMDEIRQVAEAVEIPMLFNIYERRAQDAYKVSELEAAGVKIIINCLTSTLYSAAILKKLYRDFYESGTTAAYVEKMLPMAEYTRILGIERELNL